MKKYILLFIFLTLLASIIYLRIAFPLHLSEDLLDTSRSIASFIFGALFAYYLGNSKDKHKLITNTLRRDDYLLTTIYTQSKIFPQEIQTKIQTLLDRYLIAQIDYFLEDFDKTNKEFMELYNYLLTLPTQNEKESTFSKSMFSAINSSTENRKIIESATGNRMSGKEWLTLFIFATIILLSTIGLYNGTMESLVITLLLSVGIITLLYLLYQIDGLNWRRDDYIWLPLCKLFKGLDLLPYIPKSLINQYKRKKLDGDIRVVTYPNKYPDMTNKIIEVVKI